MKKILVLLVVLSLGALGALGFFFFIGPTTPPRQIKVAKAVYHGETLRGLTMHMAWKYGDKRPIDVIMREVQKENIMYLMENGKKEYYEDVQVGNILVFPLQPTVKVDKDLIPLSEEEFRSVQNDQDLMRKAKAFKDDPEGYVEYKAKEILEQERKKREAEKAEKKKRAAAAPKDNEPAAEEDDDDGVDPDYEQRMVNESYKRFQKEEPELDIDPDDITPDMMVDASLLNGIY